MKTQLETVTPRTQRSTGPAADGLAVSVSWGDRRLASEVLSAGGTTRFSIGQSAAGDDFAAGRPGRAVFALGAGGPTFAFTDGLTGEVLRNGETPLGLSEVVHRGLAEEAEALWELPVGRHDIIRLSLGTLTVEAVPVRAPRRVQGGKAPDYQWLNVLLAVSLIASLAVVKAVLTGVERAGDDGPAASTDVAHFSHVLVKVPEKVRASAPAAPLTRPAEPPGKQLAVAGTPKPKPGPAHEGGGRPDAAVLVRQALAGLGAGNVLGAGGLGAELDKVMGAVVGNAEDKGLGGWALRGNGQGGTVGGPVGIGSVGIPGRRPGGPGGRDPVLRKGPPGEGPRIEQSAPAMCTADGHGTGCLDRETIRRIIHEHLGQIRFCYEQQLQTAPGLQGKVAVRFHVTPSGMVDDATVAESTVGRAELGTCLVGRTRLWVFPGMPFGYTVSYPFVFKPAGR